MKDRQSRHYRNAEMLGTGNDPVRVQRDRTREQFYRDNPLPETDFAMQIRRVHLFARVCTSLEYLGLETRDDMLAHVRSRDLSLPQYNIR
jgi:hypothetical protein